MSRLLWTQKQDMGPVPRQAAAMAYDAARQRTVLFGGAQRVDNSKAPQQMLGDTWEWDGEYWVQAADMGPDARYMHAMAYDAGRKVVVLFGGNTVRTGSAGDTWEWDGRYWTQVADGGPPGCYGPGMVYDEGRARVVLFGGQGHPISATNQGLYGDTWEWDGVEWVQQDDAGPAGRMFHGMAHDQVRGCTVLFGGWIDRHTGLPLGQVNDTWERTGAGWVQRSDMGPPPLARAGMAFNGRTTILFGGSHLSATQQEVVTGGTWEWDGRRWIQRQDMGPPARGGAGMAWDSDRGRLVLFGGEATATAYLGDTWELPDTEAAPGVEAPPAPADNPSA